ncbi:hypothetical protein [Rhodococcus erythropolis]|nr:hypothetical protein [Rhodococcus erythropolis]
MMISGALAAVAIGTITGSPTMGLILGRLPECWLRRYMRSSRTSWQ